MKFPTVQERPTPNAGQFNPVQANVADLSAPLKAQQQLGETIERGAQILGASAEQFRIREEKFNYSLARSKFIQDSVNLQTQLQSDPDFISYPEKYREKTQELKQKYVQDLGNNRFASLFKSEMDIYEQKTLADINEQTSKKQFFQQQAQADQNLESNLNAFTRTKDPVTQQALIQNSIELFENSIPDSDPRKPVLVQEAKKSIGKRFAETALASKTPAEQIAILNQENTKGGSTIAQFLPADQRQDWLQKAEILREKQSEAAIKSAEREQKLTEVKKDKVFIEGLKSNLSFDQLPIEVKLKATKEDVERYENLRLQQIGGQGETDEKQLNFQKYQDLYVKNPQAFANIPLSKIASEVPFSKVDEIQKWHDSAFNGSRAPVNIDEKVEVGNKFISYMGRKPSDKESLDFKKAFEQEINYFKEKNGRDPSRAELEKIGNDLITEKTFSKPGFFFGDKWPTTQTGRAFTLDKGGEQTLKPSEQEIEEMQTNARKAGRRIPTRKEIEADYPEMRKRMNLSYAIPQNVQSEDDIFKALEDESKKQPWLFENRDLKKESKEIYKRYYKYNNVG